MIALDTNVLVRFLVDDDAKQAEAARRLLTALTADRRGFVCREVAVELAWVLAHAYGFSRQRLSTVFEELVATEELEFEAVDDVARAARLYRRGGPDFSDLMIAAAAERSGAFPLYTFDRRAARLEGVELVETPGS